MEVNSLIDAQVDRGTEEDQVLQWNDTAKRFEVTTTPTGIDSITYDIDYTPPSEPEGLAWWNNMDYTINLSTGLGPVLQVGQELFVIVYNNTGSPIPNGTPVYPVGAVSGRPAVAPAKADSHSTFAGVVLITTMDIPTGTEGIATQLGKVRDFDTSNIETTTTISVGDTVWVSAATAGKLTNNKPEFPDYPIQIGGITNTGTAGTLQIDISGKAIDTLQNFWNGVFRESFDFRTVVEDQGGGDKIWGKLRPSNGHVDMTMIFSDGFTSLPTDVGEAEIELTPSLDDTVPVTNFVYIPKSTKVLTTGTEWPESVEHIKVAEVVVQTIATTKLNGALRNQNWNDHIQDTHTNQGHLPHIGRRIRILDAAWEDGCESTLSEVTGTQIDVTSGQVNQMHLQTFPGESMTSGGDIHILNDPDTPYRVLTDLDVLTKVGDGSAIGNAKWHSLVIWGVCNKTGEESHIFCNLPSGNGSYNSVEAGMSDASSKAVYSIPRQYRGVGFLIGRYVLKYVGGAWTTDGEPLSSYYQDLRGFIPNSTAGSGAGGSGITTFLGLTDTPAAYTGETLKIPQVNAGETALEFTDSPVFLKTTSTTIECPTIGISTDTDLIQLATDEVTVNGDLVIPTDSLIAQAEDDAIDLALAGTGAGIHSVLKLNTSTLGAVELGTAITSGFLKSSSSEFFNLVGGGEASTVFGGGVVGDDYRRILIRADGEIRWGSGTGVVDTFLCRTGIGELNTNGDFIVDDHTTTGSFNSIGSALFGKAGTATLPLHVYENSSSLVNGITIEQDGAGDAPLFFLLSGVERFYISLDNTDNALKFGEGNNAGGGNDLIILDPDDTVRFPKKVRVGDNLSPTSQLEVNGISSLGDGGTTNYTSISATGTQTFNGSARFQLPNVTDAGPMTATNGTESEVVYNTSDNKAYVCTATGTPATWAALN